MSSKPRPTGNINDLLDASAGVEAKVTRRRIARSLRMALGTKMVAAVAEQMKLSTCNQSG